MIKATELRIGNWVLFQTPGEPLIKKINTGAFMDLSDRLDPIPLTPEILEQCGFEINTNTVWTASNKWQKRINKKVFNVYYKEGGSRYLNKQGFIEHVHFKYLHQLQNLYFALTGKELEIKQMVHG